MRTFNILVTIFAFSVAVFSLIGIVMSEAGAASKDIVTRFDTETAVMVERLDVALQGVQDQLDPDKKVLDVATYVESVLLAPSEDEKVRKANEVLRLLKQVGIEPDSKEAVAITQKLFKTDTIPTESGDVAISIRP